MHRKGHYSKVRKIYNTPLIPIHSMPRTIAEIEARVKFLDEAYRGWITKIKKFPEQFGVKYEELYSNGGYQDYAGNLCNEVSMIKNGPRGHIENQLMKGKVIELDQVPEDLIEDLFGKVMNQRLQALADYFDLLERFPEFREMEFFTPNKYFTPARIASVHQVAPQDDHMITYIAASKFLLEQRAAKPRLDFIVINQRPEGYSCIGRTPNTRELDEMFGLYSGNGYGAFVDNQPQEASPESLEMLRDALNMTPMQNGSLVVLSYFLEMFVQRYGCFFALPYDEIAAQSSGAVSQANLNDALEEHFIRRYRHEKAGKEMVEVTTRFRPLADNIDFDRIMAQKDSDG